MSKNNYFLDLLDSGCWVIKNRSGYWKRVGHGSRAKKKALEKIEILNATTKPQDTALYAGLRR